MKRANQLIVVLAVIFFAASCRKEDVGVTPQSSVQSPTIEGLAKNEPNDDDEKKKKPLTGVLTLALGAANLPCTCTGISTSPGTFGGGGLLTELGFTNVRIQSCSTPTAGGLNVTSVCAEMIASNGDMIFTYTYPYQLMMSTSGGSATLQVDIDGGTGIYSNAKGSFVGTMTISPTFTTTFGINGTIKY